MALNLYATRDAVKARAGLDDTSDDATLDGILRDVSREIELWTGRQFWAVTQTRLFTARHPCALLLGAADLLAVTSLKTDDDGDRVYETTWAATDYDLEPYDAPLRSPPVPYWEIRVAPNGRYSFPCVARGVEIVGRWGFMDVLDTSTATLAEDLDASETGVDVTSGAVFTPGQVIEIDGERMEISAISTNTLTVERGINGTTAAAHTSGAAIRVAAFPGVAEAAIQQVSLLFRGVHAPLGVQGAPEYGQTIRGTGLHPFVKAKLQRFRIPKAG